MTAAERQESRQKAGRTTFNSSPHYFPVPSVCRARPEVKALRSRARQGDLAHLRISSLCPTPGKPNAAALADETPAQDAVFRESRRGSGDAHFTEFLEAATLNHAARERLDFLIAAAVHAHQDSINSPQPRVFLRVA